MKTGRRVNKTLEIRRHAMRDKPGQQLSDEGLMLAQYVGAQMSPFDTVVTSPLPRARETAEAMGYRVDTILQELAELSEVIFKASGWPNTLESIEATVLKHRQLQTFATKQVDLWQGVFRDLPLNGRGLIIGHGAILELGAIGCSLENKQQISGKPFGYCEGVKLSQKEDGSLMISLLRVPDKLYLLEN